MKRRFLNIVLILAMALTAVTSVLAQVNQAPSSADDLPMEGANTDNPSHPLGDQQFELRSKGLEAKMNGKVDGPVAEVAKGQFVELERQGEDSIWTVIAEFGPADHLAPILFSGIPGPLHNEIPEPDRSVDNTTIWAPDFNEAYYENLLFSEAPGAVSSPARASASGSPGSPFLPLEDQRVADLAYGMLGVEIYSLSAEELEAVKEKGFLVAVPISIASDQMPRSVQRL